MEIDMESLKIEHVIQIVGIIVGVTSVIITITCALALKWFNTMREDFCTLRKEFSDFVSMYHERHAETIKREECAARHAIIDNKVDKLHERVDHIEDDGK